MDGGRDDEKTQLTFRVADREIDPQETQLIRGPVALRRMRTWIRRGLPSAVAILLVGAVASVVALIPDPSPGDEADQTLPAVPAERDTQIGAVVAAEKPMPKRNHRRPQRTNRKHRRIVLAKPRHGKVGVNAAPAPIGSAPPFKPARREQREHNKNVKKKPEPQATLLLRRLYKDKNGDHFHSVFDEALGEKQAKGYELQERVGYLFENQVRGTSLLGIDEGVMGWIYTKDQGKSTLPLYRLVGPDYHDYEVILTSSEQKKTYWIGNGWRVQKIAGYVVRP